MSSKVTSWSFLLILAGLPLGQAALELASGERPYCLEVGPAFVERRLPQFEEDLRKASFVRDELVPLYQYGVSWLFGRGNEKAIEGREGRLFYADDIDLVTGTGILGPGPFGGRRALEVITDVDAALAERGIELVVVPIPVKGMVDSRWLAVGGPPDGRPENPDTQAVYDRLAAAGVDVIDLREPWGRWAERFPDGLFLARDTHWRPELMQRTAELVAEHVAPLLSPVEDPLEAASAIVERSGQGDLVALLRLPPGARVFAPLTFPLQPVAQDVTSATDSELLLLGDSFTKIYSDPALEMGERAGFGERLAVELGRPIDVIALVGGSSTAVRETLARRSGGLDGKRVVVWEIGWRVLAEPPGNWRDVPLPEPGDGPVVEGPAGQRVVRAELLEVSQVRDDFDYAFCLVIHRYRVLSVEAGDPPGDEVWVGFVGMRDFEVLEPSTFAVGSVHRLRLEPFGEHYDLEEDTWWDSTNDGLGADPDVPYWFAVEWGEE